VAARLDERAVLSQLPVLSITYLPNNLIICFVIMYYVYWLYKHWFWKWMKY